MSKYTEKDVRAHALVNFCDLIVKKEPKLAEKIKNSNSDICLHIISNIQKLGTHDYAKEILNKKSNCRANLILLMGGK